MSTSTSSSSTSSSSSTTTMIQGEIRSKTQLDNQFAPNITGAICDDDMRDFVKSVYGRWYMQEISADRVITSENDVALKVNATGASRTITLPIGSDDGRIIYVEKIDASVNTVTIQRGGTDTIQGGTDPVILRRRWTNVLLIKNGTNWNIITANLLPNVGSSMLLLFGNTANVQNAYMNTGHAIASNDVPYVTIRNGEVTGYSIRTNTTTGNGTIYIRKNGVDIASISITNGVTKYYGDIVGASFVAGDELSVYVETTRVNKPLLMLEIVWTV